MRILFVFLLFFCLWSCKTDTHSSGQTFVGFNKNLGVSNSVLVLARHIKTTQTTYKGYVGGRRFGNFEKKLPKSLNGLKLNYKEWDVHPKIKGKNRGAERLVSDQTGRIYYTKDHYKTFIELVL
jgi:ribonuclease T1